MFGGAPQGRQAWQQQNNAYGFRANVPQGPWSRKLHAYPPVFSQKDETQNIETGDKVLLPASCLQELSSRHIQYPMMFRIRTNINNPALARTSHCSVLEFDAEEGRVYMPTWMMDNLNIEQGSLVELTNTTLRKGTFVQFQPHRTKFTEIKNPRAVLERTMRNFSCLTVGDTIQIKFGNDVYKIDITEAKVNAENVDVVSIIETDIQVDFKEPKDFAAYEAKRKQKKDRKDRERKKRLEEDEKKLEESGLVAEMPTIGFGSYTNSKKDYFSNLSSSSQGYSLSGRQQSRSSSSTNSRASPQASRPSRSRGTPLGKQRGTPLGVKGSSLKRTSSQARTPGKKEEEVIGNMRYIYNVDQVTGNRELIRQLPLRKSASKVGYRLSDKQRVSSDS